MAATLFRRALSTVTDRRTLWVCYADTGTVRRRLASLAQQVRRVCRPFQRLFGLRAACVTGGIDKAAQLAQLRDGPLALLANCAHAGESAEGAHDAMVQSIDALGSWRIADGASRRIAWSRAADSADIFLAMLARKQYIRAADRPFGQHCIGKALELPPVKMCISSQDA